MDDGVFVAYLFKLDRDRVTFGFGGSKCDQMSKDDPTIDIRSPTFIEE